MSLDKWFKSGSLPNPCTPLGLQIGREVLQSARRHIERVAMRERIRRKRASLKPLYEADHILMHAERGDGTCSQCPAYLLRKEARRA